MACEVRAVSIRSAFVFAVCVSAWACTEANGKDMLGPSAPGSGGMTGANGIMAAAPATGAGGSAASSGAGGGTSMVKPVQAGTGGQANMAAGSGGKGMAFDGGMRDAAAPSADGSIPEGPVDPILPEAPASCPMLTTGFVTITSHNTPVSVQVWAGTKGSAPAPMLVYWHVTGGTSAEAVGGIGLPASVAQEITDAGGIIVSPQNSTGAGNDTGNSVWFTGDFDVADQLVGCAFQQYNLDPRRIYTAGGSAGALQAGTMVYERSKYLAASMPNSGGYATGGRRFQNPRHITPVMTVHGAPGVDVVIVDFSQQSLFLAGDVVKHGGFAIDCNHGGGHVGAGDDVKLAGWKFFMDHPFGVSPEPYANGLPADFPAYCKIVTEADAIANPDPLDMPDASYE